jgi:GNAT superfamily N-acetyltransferase
MHPSDHAPEQKAALGQSETEIVIRPFDPLTAIRADWTAFHAYRRARHEEAWPDDPILTDEQEEEDKRNPDPEVDSLRWVASANGRIVASLSTYLPKPDGPHFAERARFLHAYGSVLRPWRRRGLGRRLLAQVHDLMCAHDKTLLTVFTHEPDGHDFLRHIGAAEKMRSVENRLRVDGLDWTMLDCWEAATLRALPGCEFVSYGPRVPAEVLEPQLPFRAALLEDEPRDELEHAPIRVEMSTMNEWYRDLDRVGGAHHLIVLRDRDGAVVGLTDIAWDSRTPDRVYQMLTGVQQDKRGLGLAKGLKAAMLRTIRTQFPAVSQVVTYNARSNAAMRAINNRLGFTVHRHYGTYQIDRQPIGAWIAHPPG